MKGNEQFFNISPNLKTSASICRFIVRDFCGKNCWDCCILQSPDQCLPVNYLLDIPFKNIKSTTTQAETPAIADPNENSSSAQEETLEETNTGATTIKKEGFDYTKLPFLEFEEIPKDLDILDNVFEVFLFQLNLFDLSNLLFWLDIKIYQLFES